MIHKQEQLAKEIGIKVPEILEHSFTIIVNSKAYPVTKIPTFPFLPPIEKPRTPIEVMEYARYSLEFISELSDEQLGRVVRDTLDRVKQSVKKLENQ